MTDDIVERLMAKDILTSIISSVWCKTGRHPGELADLMKEAAEEITRLRAENDKLREALAAERERCAKIAEQARDDTCDGPVAWSMADCIAAALRESGDE